MEDFSHIENAAEEELIEQTTGISTGVKLGVAVGILFTLTAGFSYLYGSYLRETREFDELEKQERELLESKQRNTKNPLKKHFNPSSL